MKKLTKAEMKSVEGGVAQQIITGWTNNNGDCTVDLCFIDPVTGAFYNCRCDIPTVCADWMD